MYTQKEVKVVLLGDSGVGKSSFLLRFVNNEFHNDGSPTLGAAFLSKTIMVKEKAIKFQIWDTAGQEKYKAILPLYYRDAKVAILVYDVTNPITFEVVKDWIKQLADSGPQNQSTFKIVVGNKTDLESQVSFDEVKSYLDALGIKSLLASCKHNEGIQEAFMTLGEQILQESIIEKNSQTQNDAPPMRLTLSRSNPNSKQQRQCC